MRRREFIALIGAIVAWPFAAMAQEPGRTYRLGAVSSSPRNTPNFVAMFDELRRLGFIMGRNLTVDWRSYGPRIDLIPQFVAELVKGQVDVILVNGDAAIRAAQQATTTIPILGITEDMVGSGLVNSLARPGGNTTGTSIFATELDGKRQEILMRPFPKFAAWRCLWTQTRPGHGSLRHCRMQPAHAASSFQFIRSPVLKRSRQPSTRRRRGVPQH
jgi:putative ABC transport system substrate-binding protein